MIRILIVGVGKGIGGIEKIIFDIYKHLDPTKFKIDFTTFLGGVANQDYYEKHGSKIFAIAKRSEHFLQHYKQLRQLFQREDYDYVWMNTSSASSIATQKYAKKYSNTKVITHSHGMGNECIGGFVGRINYFADKLNRRKMIKLTDLYFACSMAAGIYLFGEANRDKIKMIHNGVDTDRYTYNDSKRNEYRKENNLQGRVICFIGRLCAMKNIFRMIDIFKATLERDPHVTLLIAGEGPLRADIEKYIEKSGIADNIRLLGNVSNVEDLMSASDAMVMTSLSEGLPLVAVEAQCNGMPCIFADTITSEAVLLESSRMLGLDESNSVWADAIINVKQLDRSLGLSVVKAKGYNIEDTAKLISEILVE